MFWRRQQGATSAPMTSSETTETVNLEPTPVSEQPIGGGPAAETANPPDEMAIFDAVHAPAETEAETAVAPSMTETLATPEASLTGAAPTTTEAAPVEGSGKGKPAKGEPAETAKGGGGGFAFGLILGAALGAAAALLFAPKSGEEMRSQLVETGMGLKNQAADSTSGVDWRPTASPWAGQAADAVQEAAASAETTARDAAGDAQQAASDLKDDAEDRIHKF